LLHGEAGGGAEFGIVIDVADIVGPIVITGMSSRRTNLRL
jgi:hypothetical protein